MNAASFRKTSGRYLVRAGLVALAAMLCSCISSGYYRLNLKYAPQKTDIGADGSLQKYMITVTQFNDERADLIDASAIGKQIRSDGSELKAISLERSPGSAVGAAIKDAFFKKGFTIYGGIPDWDASERTLQKDWGTIVVGGYIDELQTICRTGFLSAEYETRVKLRIVFADPQRKRILNTQTLESSAAYSHFYCTQARMEQELNTALSVAIEKMFDDNRVDEVIDELTRPKATTIQ